MVVLIRRCRRRRRNLRRLGCLRMIRRRHGDDGRLVVLNVVHIVLLLGQVMLSQLGMLQMLVFQLLLLLLHH